MLAKERKVNAASQDGQLRWDVDGKQKLIGAQLWRLAGQQHGQCLCRCWGLLFLRLYVLLHQLLGWHGGWGPGCGDSQGSGRNGRYPEQGDHAKPEQPDQVVASYLDRVRSLETENRKLESKIWEHLEKKGPQVRDWSHYFKTIEDLLRAQIFTNAVDNACIILQIHNAHLAADNFRVKYETELAMHQSVESDIHGLHKVPDDTDVTQLQLETEIKALKEELLFMKKNHEEEVKGLQAQIATSGLTMEVDAPKFQDLAKIMGDIWAQYDELARKNRITGQVLVSAD
ncbi:Keratin, type I cytoskeletal 18 [Saguinus oedipus]|uniref:Keratin, type I cytoskeletal 18 n=1 Tax=Saguinus oedipus TaxID=9490 RepID=A0ABQ9UZ17_SAGOE|nr:Keratin, type I cytoskeletal 18 [Saguinus oedipus]